MNQPKQREDTAVIVMDEAVWVEAVWFVQASDAARRAIGGPNIGTDTGLLDILFALRRPVAGGRWTVAYRFRYGAPSDAPEKDRKSLFIGEADEGTTADEALGKMRAIISTLSMAMPGGVEFCDEVLIQGSGQAVFDKLRRYSWFQVKPVHMTKGGQG